MAKSLIRNKIGGSVLGFALPCDETKAAEFAGAFLQGEYAVYKRESQSGNDVVSEFYRTTITGKSNAGLKTSFTILTDVSKNENEIMQAFRETTINGVKFDEVYIISMQKVR